MWCGFRNIFCLHEPQVAVYALLSFAIFSSRGQTGDISSLAPVAKLFWKSNGTFHFCTCQIKVTEISHRFNTKWLTKVKPMYSCQHTLQRMVTFKNDDLTYGLVFFSSFTKMLLAFYTVYLWTFSIKSSQKTKFIFFDNNKVVEGGYYCKLYIYPKP